MKFIFIIFCSLLLDAGIQLSTDPEVMLEQVQTKWQVIVTHYAGILAVAVVGLVIAIAVPVTGFFICCCRCAGKTTTKEFRGKEERNPLSISLFRRRRMLVVMGEAVESIVSLPPL